MIKPPFSKRLAKTAATLAFFLLLSLCSYGQKMQAHFINVGQADAALLEFPCGAVLIDAGAQDSKTVNELIAYLDNFFTRRTDLHRTLDLVIISHDHKDHDLALPEVAKKFKIKNYIDNGHHNPHSSGEPMQGHMETWVKANGIPYETFSYEQITAHGNVTGLTDKVITPLHCSIVSPEITLLSGRLDKQGAWSDTDYKNENNHSVIVKVRFGKASFLFTGDLERAGDHQLLSYYAGSKELDADVWKVSHHGAANGTSKEWVEAITPKYAVISCGAWFDGDHTNYKINTYHYGHPRLTTLNFLEAVIPGDRPPLDTPIVAFKGIKTNNVHLKVKKNIYCTAWDGNITITADKNGAYTVERGK